MDCHVFGIHGISVLFVHQKLNIVVEGFFHGPSANGLQHAFFQDAKLQFGAIAVIHGVHKAIHFKERLQVYGFFAGLFCR